MVKRSSVVEKRTVGLSFILVKTGLEEGKFEHSSVPIPTMCLAACS